MATKNTIKFETNVKEINEEIERIVQKWLIEASEEMVTQTATRTRRASGETAEAWQNKVDKDNYIAYVGNPLENAIWEEFGTGEYALKDNGRKGGWTYYDETKKKFYHTYGKTPNRALHNAFKANEEPLKDMLKNLLKGL
jgi:hypothetical protein